MVTGFLSLEERKQLLTPPINANKTVQQRANKYSALSNLTQQNKPNPSTYKLPPKPTPNDVSRGPSVPKRHRQEDFPHVPIIKQSSTTHKVKTPLEVIADQQDPTKIIGTLNNSQYTDSQVKHSYANTKSHATPHTHETQINHNLIHENNYENAINHSNSTKGQPKASATDTNINQTDEETMVAQNKNDDTQGDITSSIGIHESLSETDEDMVT
jgi:hypothetical protein